jgi:hypothetical protein
VANLFAVGHGVEHRRSELLPVLPPLNASQSVSVTIAELKEFLVVFFVQVVDRLRLILGIRLSNSEVSKAAAVNPESMDLLENGESAKVLQEVAVLGERKILVRRLVDDINLLDGVEKPFPICFDCLVCHSILQIAMEEHQANQTLRLF